MRNKETRTEIGKRLVHDRQCNLVGGERPGTVGEGEMDDRLLLGNDFFHANDLFERWNDNRFARIRVALGQRTDRASSQVLPVFRRGWTGDAKDQVLGEQPRGLIRSDVLEG